MSFRSFSDVLNNGIRVVTVETPHLHSAMVTIYARVGSRYETPENNGVSHLLEHLFFRGSAKFPDTVQMNARVEAVGGNLNGVTARDLSYYFTPVHPTGVAVALEVLGDMLTRPRLSHLKVEKEIILEEMLDEVDEDGRDIDLENLSKQVRFGAHPLGLKIAGTPESVRAMSFEQVKAHYARHYTADNLIVGVAGPVKRAQVLALARKHFGRVPSGEVAVAPPPPDWTAGPKFSFVRSDEAQTSFRISFATVAAHHPDSDALIMLRRILDDGLSSRLPFNVVERRGLAYSVGASVEEFADTGSFDVDGACAPTKVAATVREIFKTIGTLRRGEISREELSRARVRYRMSVEAMQDSPGDLLGWFAGEAIFREPTPLEELVKRIDGLTLADLRRAAKKYLGADRLLVVSVGPSTGVRGLRALVKSAPYLR